MDAFPSDFTPEKVRPPSKAPELRQKIFDKLHESQGEPIRFVEEYVYRTVDLEQVQYELDKLRWEMKWMTVKCGGYEMATAMDITVQAKQYR